eukprot:TCALIF_00723-PA protein Name:"Similar to RBM17 Splicing factor 45 (Homo sapiens)" AED:0.34 eAED:0.38 QI:8/0/0/0.42/0.83/0.71/7/0/508
MSSLYDDEEDVLSTQNQSSLGDWSKGVSNLRPSSGLLGLKPPKPQASPLMGLHHHHHPTRKLSSASPGGVTLPPVINLHKGGVGLSGIRQGMSKENKFRGSLNSSLSGSGSKGGLLPLKDPTWAVVNEYDPLWPNDYLKVKQDMKDTKSSGPPRDRDEDRRRYSESARDRARERFSRDSDPYARRPDSGGGSGPSSSSGLTGSGLSPATSGFGRRPKMSDDYSDPEDEDDSNHHHHHHSDPSGSRRDRSRSGRRSTSGRNSGSMGSSSSSSSAGAAIAPPPSLMEAVSSPSGSHASSEESPSTTKLANTLASGAGLGRGQGLGREEQGMAQALAVEKTSRRGGRILHEKDFVVPPPPLFNAESPATPPGDASTSDSGLAIDDCGNVIVGPSKAEEMAADGKPSITDLMKNPSKVVLCKNMVGPGEVDNDLEPEVKEECHVKYGDVNKVIIFELPNAIPEEAVRIFIEFKRVESAIKAVVDLNGRFFGGREVQASFYNVQRFANLQLNE